MKLAVIADIHLDLNSNHPIMDLICQRAVEEGAQVLIIAGDLSNDCETTLRSVEELKGKFPGEVYFVAGNHDMFNINGKYDSTYTIYDRYMKHENSLMGRDVALNDDWVLLGDMFWYDYSFADQAKYSDAEFRIQTHEGYAWADFKYIDWGNDDKAIAEILLRRMEERLKKHRGKNLIVISHMVMDRDFVGYERYSNTDYFSAFLGSEKIGAMMERYGVKYAVMGHVHLRREKQTAVCTYLCPCLGYAFEWESPDAAAEAASAMKIIEI